MYRPSGSTNLNDAIGETITEMLETKTRKKQNTLVIVMTDGYENSSRKWHAEQVANLVRTQEKRGWTVTFLGANIDTAEVGRTYAIKTGNLKSYSTENMAGTMRGLAGATATYACSTLVGSSCDSFFEGTDDWTESNDKQKTTVSDLSLPDISKAVGSVAYTTNPFNIQTSVWGHSSQEDVDKWKKEQQIKKGGRDNG